MKSQVSSWLFFLFVCCPVVISAVSNGSVKAKIRGRLARILCMQYRLDQNFTSPVPSLKSPVYDIQDIPCRIIRMHNCSAGSTTCKRFSSIVKIGCPEELQFFNLEHGPGLESGDVPAPPNQTNSTHEKATFRDKSLKWPGCCLKPTMWYKFSSEEPKEIVQNIKNAIVYLSSCFCIRFETLRKSNPPDPPDYVEFTYEDGACYSTGIGRKGGRQVVNIGKSCAFGTIVHEILHALGFGHEHARPDRNQNVDVFPDRALPNYRYIIRQRFKWEEWDSLKTAYDYHSIMHYNRFAYTDAKKQPTILPQQDMTFIGQRCGLSETDAEQAIRLYKCDKSVYPTPECKLYKPNLGGEC